MTTHKPRHAESKLHRKLVLFTVALERQLAHFPSCHKHAISQRLRNLNLDVYELVVEAQKSFHKKTPLGKLDKAHEKVRMLLWVAFEMKLFAANKDARFVELIMQFAERPEETGVPIGNLLSQVSANVTLNSLDHFCKRDLGLAHYGRYMDDSIMIVANRRHGEEVLDAITDHLAQMRLEISHYRLHPIRRGANFVGFRTWRDARFIRKHCLREFRRDVRAGRIESAISRLGHARKTHSLQHMLHYAKDHHHDLYRRLPQSLVAAHRRHARNA